MRIAKKDIIGKVLKIGQSKDIAPAQKPRAKWKQQFEEDLKKDGKDICDFDNIVNDFDRTEWKW